MKGWKLNWGRTRLGLLTGAANFATFMIAAAWALRNGLSGPSYWYDMPVVLALIFLPPIAWLAHIARLAVKSRGDGKPAGMKVLHGIVYLSAEPAGFGLAILLARTF